MRKILFIILLSISFWGISEKSYSQSLEFQYTTYINGYWGGWKNSYYYKITGTWQDFVIFKDNVHPSKYLMKVAITYQPYSKKEIKRKTRNKEWFTYTGTIEYFVCSGKNCKHRFPCTQLDLQSWPYDIKSTSKEYYKKTVPVTVKMDKPIEKKGNRTINIFFNNQGIGITL